MVRTDEAGHEQVDRPVVEHVGRGDLLQDAAAHHRHPVSHRHRLDLVVGDVQRGDPQVLLQAEDLRPGLHPQLGVEVGQRFVHQEGGRFPHDRPAHGDPLALATGQGAGPARQQFLDAEQAGSPLDAAADLGLVDLAQLQPEADVLGHAEVRVEGVVLEHHGQVTVAGVHVVDCPLPDADRSR
jgi:hypothetical protein